MKYFRLIKAGNMFLGIETDNIPDKLYKDNITD